MSKRPKTLTKRERKALTGPGPSGSPVRQQQHIHCIACGRHLDPHEFDATPPSAKMLRCEHGSTFPSCADCEPRSRELIAEHDRTGTGVRSAPAWH